MNSVRLIRRCFKYGETIALKPDNPDEEFELVIDKDTVTKYRIYSVNGNFKNKKNLYITHMGLERARVKGIYEKSTIPSNRYGLFVLCNNMFCRYS